MNPSGAHQASSHQPQTKETQNLDYSPKSVCEMMTNSKGQKTVSTSLGGASQVMQSKLETSHLQQPAQPEGRAKHHVIVKQGSMAGMELSPFSSSLPRHRGGLLQKHMTNLEAYCANIPDGKVSMKGGSQTPHELPTGKKNLLLESRTLSSGVKITNLYSGLPPATPETGRFIRKSKRGASIGFFTSETGIMGGSMTTNAKLLETVKERSHNLGAGRTPGQKSRQLAIKLRKGETLEPIQPQSSSHRRQMSTQDKKLTISNFAELAQGNLETQVHRGRAQSNHVDVPRSKTPRERDRRKKRLHPQASQESETFFHQDTTKKKMVTMKSEMLDHRSKSVSKVPNIQIVVNLPDTGAGVYGLGKSLADVSPHITTRSQGECSCKADAKSNKEAKSEHNHSSDSCVEDNLEGREAKSVNLNAQKNKSGTKILQPSESLTQFQTKQSGQLSMYTFMKPAQVPGTSVADDGKSESCRGSQQKYGHMLRLPQNQLQPPNSLDNPNAAGKLRVKSFRNLLKEVENESKIAKRSEFHKVGDFLKSQVSQEVQRAFHQTPSLQDLPGSDILTGGGKLGKQPSADANTLQIGSPNTRRLKRLKSSGQVSYQSILPTKVHTLKHPSQQSLHRRQESMPLVSSRFAVVRICKEIPEVPVVSDSQQANKQPPCEKGSTLDQKMECLLSKENEEDDEIQSLLSQG